MDRRQFLCASGCALAASAPLVQAFAADMPPQSVAPSNGRIDLFLSHRTEDGFDRHLANVRDLIDRIEARTQNRYAIGIASQDHAPPSGLRLAGASELVDVDRGFAYATGLPGRAALDAPALRDWLTAGGGQGLLDELSARHGTKVLIVAHNGPSYLWSKTPMRQASDFAGKYVRADGLARSVAAGLGAEPWRIVQGSSQHLFNSGSMTAIEASVNDAMAQQLLASARYASADALVPHGTTLALQIGLDLWNAMGPADQAAFTAAADENYRASVKTNQAYADLNQRALRQSYATDLAPVPEQLAGSIQTVARAMIAQAAATSELASRMDASYMAYLHTNQHLTGHGNIV